VSWQTNRRGLAIALMEATKEGKEKRDSHRPRWRWHYCCSTWWLEGREKREGRKEVGPPDQAREQRRIGKRASNIQKKLKAGREVFDSGKIAESIDRSKEGEDVKECGSGVVIEQGEEISARTRATSTRPPRSSSKVLLSARSKNI